MRCEVVRLFIIIIIIILTPDNNLNLQEYKEGMSDTGEKVWKPNPLENERMSAIDRQAAHHKSRDSREKSVTALEIGVGETGTNDKPLGLGGLTMVIYFGVCGGAVYAEELVGSQGPLIGIIAMIVYPLIVGLPQCLVTAEYATAFKGNGGFLSWINCAYGGKATQMVAFMNYLCMTADTSLYPPMALDYAAATWPALQPLSDNPFAFSSYLFKASFATIFFLFLLTGLQPIGKGLQVLILIVMIPQTLLIFLFGFGKMDFSLLGGTKYTPYLNETSNEMITDSSRGTDFFYFLNVLVWNYSAFCPPRGPSCWGHCACILSPRSL